MATNLKSSTSEISEIPSGKGKRFGIVVSEWNSNVTLKMRDAAVAALIKNSVAEEDIKVHYVPGSFELTLGAEWVGKTDKIDAVICIGCVIRGETPHFDFICQGVAYGLTELNLSLSKPVIFAVLTTNTLEQAVARSGGVLGNKGDEAAITALKMLGLRDELKKNRGSNNIGF